MLSVTFTTILTCSTRYKKKQILDHVIHDVLPVQKHVSACFGECHQNHCFLIVISSLPCLFPLVFCLLAVHLNSAQYLISFFARLFLFKSYLVLLRLNLALLPLSCDNFFSLYLHRYNCDVVIGGHNDGLIVVD